MQLIAAYRKDLSINTYNLFSQILNILIRLKSEWTL